MNKLVGIIALDIVLTISPLLNGVAPELVKWISYIFMTMTILIVLTLVSSKEGSDELKKVELEHRERPRWWDFYDLVSDGLFIAMWTIHGFYGVVWVLIVMKIFVLIKIPNYYKRVNNG